MAKMYALGQEKNDKNDENLGVPKCPIKRKKSY